MAIRRAAVAALASLGILAAGSAAYASDVAVAVVDVTTPTTAVTLAPGATSPITINLTVTGRQEGTATFEVYRDWSLSGGTFTGSNPEEFTVSPQSGGTTTRFSTSGTVSVAPGQGQGDFTLAVGAFDITNTNATGAKLSAGASASYAVTVTAPTNTKPSVAVTGFTDGAAYELGVDPLPTAQCVVTDDHDVVAPFPAVMSGEVTHGLGTLSATCDYVDKGGLAADTVTASYSIVDTRRPTISHTLSAEANVHGWYNTDVTVAFTCADNPGSGIQSCAADGETGPSRTVSEGENQSVTGTATDWAGNTATVKVLGINVDKTEPTVDFTNGPSGTYYFGDTLPPATCDASDTLSGIDGTCTVTLTRVDGRDAGDGTAVGDYTLTARAMDKAGNTATKASAYSVLAWNLKGFYQPVDVGGVLNTVKGGSTVPLKFEVFRGTEELTATSAIKSFTQTKIVCDGSSPTDEVEVTTTGGTSLRYDATGGQFIQNWQTPKSPGSCYRVTMTTQDGSTISANFKLK